MPKAHPPRDRPARSVLVEAGAVDHGSISAGDEVWLTLPDAPADQDAIVKVTAPSGHKLNFIGRTRNAGCGFRDSFAIFAPRRPGRWAFTWRAGARTASGTFRVSSASRQ